MICDGVIAGRDCASFRSQLFISFAVVTGKWIMCDKKGNVVIVFRKFCSDLDGSKLAGQF